MSRNTSVSRNGAGSAAIARAELFGVDPGEEGCLRRLQIRVAWIGLGKLDRLEIIDGNPSVEEAVAAYNCPAYREALKVLGDGAVRDVRVVEGWVKADDISDFEIAVLCDLLNGPGVNLKAHKKAILDQLLEKELVVRLKNDPARVQLSDKAHHLLAERGVGMSGG